MHLRKRKPNLKKITIPLLTTFMLLGTLVQPRVFAESITQPQPITASNQQQDLEQAGRIEIPSLRTETSKVYENPDGTLTAEVMDEPIHYKEGNSWVDIDNTLVNNSDGTEIENKHNDFKVEFKKDVNATNNHELLTYQINQKQIQLFLSPDSQNLENENELNNVTANNQANEVSYHDLYPDISFQYKVDGSKVKENIILDSYKGIHTFQFFIKASGLTASKQADGTILFKDEKTGSKQFFLQSPFMFESDKELLTSSNVSHDVTQDIKPVPDGFILTVNADENYLKDPNRAKFSLESEYLNRTPLLENVLLYHPFTRSVTEK
jgi:hypothetical protein